MWPVAGAAGNFLCAAGALSTNAFRTVVDIDTVGTFTVSRTAHELWLGAHGGVIVNITATLDYRGNVMQAHAGAAKAAISAWVARGRDVVACYPLWLWGGCTQTP